MQAMDDTLKGFWYKEWIFLLEEEGSPDIARIEKSDISELYPSEKAFYKGWLEYKTVKHLEAFTESAGYERALTDDSSIWLIECFLNFQNLVRNNLN